MKKYFIILTIILSSCGGGDGGGSNGTVETTKQSGFYYSFDNTGANIIDTSGATNNATAKAISRVDGKVGGAVKFQTDGSVINAPTNAFPNTESLSFSAWIKTDMDFTSRQQIIGGSSAGDPGSFYPISNFGISFINNKLSFEVSAYPNMLSVESSILPIGLNQWFHVVVTYNGSQVKFYYNGQLINEGSIITSFDASPPNNQIGNNYHVFGGIQIKDQYFGYIDELYLEESVRTDKEILDYYNSTK